MSDNNSQSPPNSPEALIARMEILQSKLELINAQLSDVMRERNAMEIKIADAQTRIQKILNKLPQSADARQLTLLDIASIESDPLGDNDLPIHHLGTKVDE